MPKDWQVSGLMREDLDVFVFLGGTCFGSAIEEEESFHGFVGVDGLFEIIFG